MSSTFTSSAWKLGAFALCWMFCRESAGAGTVEQRPPSLVLRSEAAAGAPLRLVADQLSYHPEQGRIEMRGRARLDLGPLRLSTARLSIFLDGKGLPREARASGGVKVTIEGASGASEEVILLPRDSQLELRGKAQLRLSSVGLDLQGARIRVDLRTGRLSVEAARVRLGPAALERSSGTSAVPRAGRRP